VPSLKSIRKRISSVKSTQKITRAMKMVAGAKLNRAQQRILELRPYAVKTQAVLARLTKEQRAAAEDEESAALAVVEPAEPVEAAPEIDSEGAMPDKAPPPARQLTKWLEERADRPGVEKRVLIVVMTSDRGLCGAFNTNINKRAERENKERSAAGQEVKLAVVGRKGRDYLTRRGISNLEYIPGVWDKLNYETAKAVGAQVLKPLFAGDVDAVYLLYSEFKSAMSQNVVVERLLPVQQPEATEASSGEMESTDELIFEPNKDALLEQLVPMYIDISILRALYESQASFLGAQMTAMDSATKNAKEMIQSLTLQYNKARQASITKELMEIIGGSEALKE
jgi:F-type H+-transporting ATPase subunit gamma